MIKCKSENLAQILGGQNWAVTNLPHLQEFRPVHVLWGFSLNTLSLVYNSAEQENIVLCIFKFQGPYGTQMDLGFFED